MTILNKIDFTDPDSKNCVSGDNDLYYVPFETAGVVLAATEDQILTGQTSGATIKVLKDANIDDLEVFAKVVTGTPEPTGEIWENVSAQTIFTGTGGDNEGTNVYLNLGDEYYQKLLRDFGIDPTDTGLADPPIFQVKRVLICFVEIEIFGDLIDDSRAPYENQEVLIDKYRDKLSNAEKCHDKWMSQLDENAFYDTPKGTDSPCVGTFGRR